MSAEQLQGIKYWTSLDGTILTIDNEEIANKVKGERKIQLIKEFDVKINVKKTQVIIQNCYVTKKMCAVFAKILELPYVSEQLFTKYKNNSEEIKNTIQPQENKFKLPQMEVASQEPAQTDEVEPKWEQTVQNKRRQQLTRPEVMLEDNFLVVPGKTSVIKEVKQNIAEILCLDPDINFERISFKTV
ncbi:hypothetical protein TVAG_105630 [Trichomonas vaginalis G3]|uniref:Uncharacterized protein n=1 Tax=Trichomonas vaginalis (strain ATCC PRA-98 / G3) TaxID=412133 RepID=A2FLQ2_TRIV3|nr:hypothetical protein TVAGG3_0515470 [Trichomonas vaginalis G3]EAX94144.1 hypothetical protein TVAG_105630 [Trichomonas vaginalis G3]KAI5518089.1 hypothetical protein TVAGG3_0515470 [Trichomonas vaginalis G3]|eukprot:XP_001307074.1 hypothetical protein [Trichomonas vaginalis G3]